MVKVISIMSAWSDDNKGDAGILTGLIELIQSSNVGNDLQINVISRFSADSADFNYYHRFISKYNVGIYSAILPLPVEKMVNRLNYRLQMIKEIFFSLFILLFATKLIGRQHPPFLNNNELETLSILSQTDLVVIKGGHEIYTGKGIGGFIAFYIRMFQFLLALRLKRNVIIYGQSIGPVESAASRWLLRFVLKRCKYILVREPLSHHFILEGIEASLKEKSGVTWDTGFFIGEELLPDEVISKLPPEFVACTLRPWNFPETPQESAVKYRHYLETMAEVIYRIKRQCNLPVILVPQVIGPSTQVSDYTAWADLKKYLHDQSDVIEIRADLSPGQLVSVYKKAQFIIGTRFHSVIFSMVAHTPSIAISYHGFKTRGIMKMLGWLDYVFEIDGIDINQVWKKVEQIRVQKTQISTQLEKQVTQIRSESLTTAQLIFTLDKGENEQ